MLIEAAVDSLEAALAAERTGAARIELCGDLDIGGVTPSWELLTACRARLRVPICAMIRPRGGDFVYTDAEVSRMIRDIGTAFRLSAHGVVLGALREDGTVDESQMSAFMSAAGPQPVVFHRAFDAAIDADAALDTVIRLGVTRVLTGGHAGPAAEGIPALSRLVARSAGRITILAGGGVSGDNVRSIVSGSGVTEVHARCLPDGKRIRDIVAAMDGP